MMKEENEPEAEKPTYKEDRSRSLADENDDKIIKIEADMESELEIPTSYEDGSRSPSGENVNISIKTENNIESNVAMTISKEEQLKRSIKAILGENLEENIDEGKVNIFVTVNVNGSTDEGPNIVQEPQGQDKQLTQRQNKKRTRRSSKSHLQCTFCGKVMSSEYRLQCHVGKHTGAAAGTCKFCDKNFSDIGSLKRHYKTCQRDKNFPCKLCGFVFISQKILDRHMTRHSLGIKKEYNEEAMNCDSNEIVLSDQNSKPHKITELSEDVESPDDNPIDDPMSYQEIYPRDDPLLPDPLEKPKLKCRYCGKVISNPRSLKYHETGHTRDNPITCVVCDKVFYHPHTARNHISNCEKKIRFVTGRQGNMNKVLDCNVRPKPELKCKFCDKVLMSLKSLQFHENKHTGENSVACPICDKIFYNPNTVRDHIKKCEEKTLPSSQPQANIEQDSEVKPKPELICKFCGKVMLSSRGLKYHENKHTGENPINCEICDKVFYYPNTARDHIKNCQENLRTKSRTQDNIKQGENSDMKKTHHGIKSENFIFGEKGSDVAEDTDIPPSSVKNSGREAKGDGRVLKCRVCGEFLEDRKGYRDHMSSQHPGENAVLCQFCGRTYFSQLSLKYHLKICKLSGTKQDSQRNSYRMTTCKVCGKNVHDLSRHILVHTGEKPFQCLECGERFRQNGGLNRHCKSVHTDVRLHICSICGKEFNRKSNLKSHMRIHTEKDHPFQCDLCSKYFSSKESLHVHKKNHAGNKKYLCTICGKGFTRSDSFNTHRVTLHNIAKPYSCERCGKGFLMMCFLTKHRRSCDGTGVSKINRGMRSNHTFSDQKYKCDICSKTISARNFKNHMRSHTGEKPFVCSVCGKSFIYLRSLKYHTMFHSGERPFKCDQCEKEFKTSNHLMSHMRTHTGEKPYKCDICGRSFNQSENLSRHRKIHDDKRPYECKTCGMSFKFIDVLKRHEQRHTGEKPFKCKVCERAFSDARPLKKHMLIHTQIN